MTDTTQPNPAAGDEAELRALIARWSMLMFDVPPPFLSRGLDACLATCDTFFTWQAKPVQFALHDVALTAGTEVAFATAIGLCCDLSSGGKVDLEFRLTMGFRKFDG